MSPWDRARPLIDAAFNDPEPLIYTGGGLAGAPIKGIWSDVPADPFAGPGATLRKVTYELPQSAFPSEPRKGNTFTHRGHLWTVEDRTRRSDIDKWLLVVIDSGAAG